MKVQKFGTLGLPECSERLMELLHEQFTLRMQHATGQLANTARIRAVRREISRVRTEIHRKSRGGV